MRFNFVLINRAGISLLFFLFMTAQVVRISNNSLPKDIDVKKLFIVIFRPVFKISSVNRFTTALALFPTLNGQSGCRPA